MGIARELAEYAASLRFEDLPAEVVHQTKRLVLDTLGCALGGVPSETGRVLREFASEAGHPGEAAVVGSGAKTSALLATLVNGAMVRYLDYNDTAFILQGDIYRTGYLCCGNSHIHIRVSSSLRHLFIRQSFQPRHHLTHCFDPKFRIIDLRW